jgi:ribosome-binding protein aMBF1 (putative translation factor)
METLGVAVRPARERIEKQIEKLGPAVRRLRQERGLTLEELAGEVGSSVAHLSRLESGGGSPRSRGCCA